MSTQIKPQWLEYKNKSLPKPKTEKIFGQTADAKQHFQIHLAIRPSVFELIQKIAEIE